jgi:23S rRNA (cytosine1962-C5)-methyltransferase
LPTVRITRKGAERIRSGHPWVFASDVADRADAQPGDVVRVAGPGGQILATAHYSAASEITLRVLAAGAPSVDETFYRRRLDAAADYRARLFPGETACRLVFSEADLLPGLTIDRYGDCFVVQALTQGMDRALPAVVDWLEERFAPRAIVARHDAAVRAKENLPREVKLLRGALDAPVTITLSGLTFQADLLHGQKTGVYLDQRENYAAARRHARGEALDCFTSSGGFALHLAGACPRVTAIDSSAAALAGARANAAANGIVNVQFEEADVFDYLARVRRDFDTVVLDPPAFAKSRRALAAALRGYRDLNLRALRRLRPGGVLISCSCSHHVSEADLLEAIAAAALDAQRTLRIRERRTQSPDHPILLTVPETLYLKCLIFDALD